MAVDPITVPSNYLPPPNDYYISPTRFHALYAQGEQVHLAPTADTGAAWQASLRHISYEGRVFVVSCCQVLHRFVD